MKGKKMSLLLKLQFSDDGRNPSVFAKGERAMGLFTDSRMPIIIREDVSADLNITQTSRHVIEAMRTWCSRKGYIVLDIEVTQSVISFTLNRDIDWRFADKWQQAICEAAELPRGEDLPD